MKKCLALITLGMMLATAAAQEAAESAQQPAGQPAAGQSEAQQQVVIKDPTEYNAYIAAINQKDPAAKANALEAFLATYPNSVVKRDALELLMATYSQAGDTAKAADTASRLLQTDPNNVRALALLVYSERAAAEAGQNPQQNLTQAKNNGERGLQALQIMQKPAGQSDADFQKLKNETATIFNGAIGIADLQVKDYQGAQEHLLAAVQSKPNDLRNVYPLALSYFQQQPSNDIQGLWYIARAAALATGTPAEQQITAFGQNRYKIYHGGTDGWDQLVAQAKTSPLPPPGFTVKPAPSQADLAHQALVQNGVEKLGLADWEYILQNGYDADAQQVSQYLQSKGVAEWPEAKVVNATTDTLELALGPDAQQKNVADIEVTMAKPLTRPPRVGEMIKFIGKVESFRKNPVVIVMDQGGLVPNKKPPVRRRRPHRG